MAKLTTKQKREIIKKYGKIPTKDEVFQKLRESQERMIVSLAAAWETAPDDPKIRKQLLEAIEKAVKFRERLYTEVLEEEPPEIRESYTKLRKILEKELFLE